MALGSRKLRVILFLCPLFTLLYLLNYLLVWREFVFFSFDFTWLVRRVAPKTMCEQWKYSGCQYDLCHVAHEGGEGTLFEGNCNNEGPVLFKHAKISNKQSTFHEVRATQILESHPNTTLKLLDYGYNFLVLTKLVGYTHLPEIPKYFSVQQADRLITEFIQQIMSQLSWLHRHDYIHGDVHHANVLYNKDTGVFQLIDMSGALPIQQERRILRVHRHLPRLPGTAPCIEFFDMYPLAVLSLEKLHKYKMGETLRRTRNHKEQHEILLKALSSLDYSQLKSSVFLLNQLVRDLNTTWVCSYSSNHQQPTTTRLRG